MQPNIPSSQLPVLLCFQQHKSFKMRIFFRSCPGGHHRGRCGGVWMPGCPPRAISASPCPACNLHCCPELGSAQTSAALGEHPQETPTSALRMEERLRSSCQVWEPLGLIFAQDRSLSLSLILPLFQLQGKKKSEWESRSTSDIAPSVTGKGKTKAAVKNHQQLVLARTGKPELSMNLFFFLFARKVAFLPERA